MTCIVYRDGVLAADTWVLDVWTRVGMMSKIAYRPTKHGNILFGVSGSSGLSKKFLDWGRSKGFADWAAGEAEPPVLQEGDQSVSAMAFLPDGTCVRFDPGTPPYTLSGPFFAMGSGAWVAVGALAAGKSAEEAVRLTSDWDVGTSNRIQVLRH